MNNTEQSHSIELIQQAKGNGLINSNSSIQCVHCKAIFPEEYNKCPQCEVDKLWETIQIQYKNRFGEK